METCKYSREQLIAACHKEYEYLCHDDFDPDEDMTMDEHLQYLNKLSVEELINETDTDEEYTLNDYMAKWKP